MNTQQHTVVIDRIVDHVVTFGCLKCHQTWLSGGLPADCFTPNHGKAADPVDMVRSPKHYQILDGVEAIDVIASSMTLEGWHGYCLGNIIKYRLRSGNKGSQEQDIDKADFYAELFYIHKHLCRGENESISKSDTKIGAVT